MLFDKYAFADYSGAASVSAQRRAICMAIATRNSGASIIRKRLTRDGLVDALLAELREGTRTGARLCFGQDHQYGIPMALGVELNLQGMTWRAAVASLVTGSYGVGAPSLAHPREFSARLNSWLVARGSKEYFYSATKAGLHAVAQMRAPPRLTLSTLSTTAISIFAWAASWLEYLAPSLGPSSVDRSGLTQHAHVSR
jgi:hypothetical protein